METRTGMDHRLSRSQDPSTESRVARLGRLNVSQLVFGKRSRAMTRPAGLVPSQQLIVRTLHAAYDICERKCEWMAIQRVMIM
jgi:hypothetical protein